ncbi:MAG: TonB-dependent receptor [Saprospiraceae bacterium]
MNNKILTILIFLISLQVVFGQNGTVRGKMTDATTGEPIMFGNVVIKNGEVTGTTSDLDGNYDFSLAAGTYNIEFSYIGLRTVTITDIVINEGKVTIVDVNLEEDAEIIEEIIVTAKATRNTEVALATLKKNAVNVIDGITSANFKKIGDSDAASAMKRVTGVSVEGGKYVYVRGLGDRYTKSILNGMEVPGLDPDRNALQMDIFPTNILDNIIVLKSFTADLPADFTGGVVNITTKDFPEEKTGNISLGLNYNPSMHLKSDYLTSSTSSTDFLGFDDGLREIPTNQNLNIPFRTDAISDPAGAGSKFRNILLGFNPNMAVKPTNSFMDYNLGFSYGNQHNKKRFDLGYNIAASYSNATEFYTDVEYNMYGKDRDPSIFQLEQRIAQKGDYGSNSVLLASIGGISLKTNTSKFSLSLMHIQNGESKNGIFDYSSTNFGANFTAFQHNIEYSQKSMSNALLKGTHILGKGKWNIMWNLSPTLSSIYDPDIRIVRYRTDGTALTIGTESGIPERTWRFLDEINLSGNVSADYGYIFNKNEAKLKFGTAYTYKERDFEIQNFQIYPNGITLTGDPDEIFLEENIWSTENPNGTTYDPQFIPFNPNKFNSSATNLAGFVSNEMLITPKIKTILGLRAEQFNQLYTGRNQSGESFNNKEVFNTLNFFPTANVIFKVKENQNFRVSYARTIARPSFKESSYATIVDPISGRTFIGGFFQDIDVSTGEIIWDGNLVNTDIDNYDLRWEHFSEGGQSISLSTFYKKFTNPIEIVQYVQAVGNFQPRNVGDGSVLGVELELIKNLGFINGSLSNLSFNLNTTFAHSEIKMSASELKSRQLTTRTGETVEDSRQMAGQAPYLINSGLSYKNPNNKLEIGVFYNVQGRTLRYVGIADRPDVFTQPFHSLNLNVNLPFGNEEQFNVGFKVNNLLGSGRKEVFSSYNADDETFSYLNPGSSFALRFGYKM